MRIVHISSYPPIECGIATYTQYLTDEMKKQKRGHEIYIVGHYGSHGDKVFATFDYNDRDLYFKAFETAMRFTPDVVHVQHEFGLFGIYSGINILPLIQLLRMNGVPVVVTLHTVYKSWTQQEKFIAGNIVRFANSIIVHEPFQLDIIKDSFPDVNPNKFDVIPHGARKIERIANAKELLKLDKNDKVVLIIGYFRPSKKLDVIVDIFPDILKQVPNARLIVAGKTRLNEYLDYRDYFFNKINNSPAIDRILELRGQFPQDVFDRILSAADVIPLPYDINSQSGIFAHCLAFGVPTVCSDNPSMRRILEESKGGFVVKDKDEFIAKIVKILNDDKLASSMRDNIKDFLSRTCSWEIITDKTLEIYHRHVSTPYGKSKYIWV